MKNTGPAARVVQLRGRISVDYIKMYKLCHIIKFDLARAPHSQLGHRQTKTVLPRDSDKSTSVAQCHHYTLLCVQSRQNETVVVIVSQTTPQSITTPMRCTGTDKRSKLPWNTLPQ